MSLENPSQKIEGSFKEKFPHLHHLTEAQQEHFLVLHSHNENREANDKKTEEQLLSQIQAIVKSNMKDKREVQPRIGIEEELNDIHIHAEQEKAQTVKKITTNVVDFIPIVGSIKMILEGLKGKQYGTEKEITGSRRLVHGISGVVFLGLDITGVGAIASEVGKGVIKIGERALVRNAEEALAREVVEKEATKLAVRGEKRIDRKEKIAKTN
jgi:hypothetical protein